MTSIVTNVAANNSLRYVNMNTNAQNNYLSQLSSGSRITRASSDASSLAIGVRIKSDSNTLTQASSNAAIAQSVLNIADGGYARTADVLARMKQLAVQAQSGSQDTTSLANIDKEYQALLGQLGTIATSTRFNGNNLLDGTSTWGTGAKVLLGTAAADTISITLGKADATTLGVNGGSLTSTANAVTAAAAIDTAINTLSGTRAQLGADQSRLDFQKNVVDTAQENTAAATSTLLDADIARVQTEYTNASVLTEAGIAALQKANSIPQQLLNLLKS